MRLRNRDMWFIILFITSIIITAYASNVAFSSNVEAINAAAQSVLMLEVYDSNDELIATGSGFVAFDNYTLVTNQHVIEDAEMIIAFSDDGHQYMITKLIAADEKRDVAILEFFSPTNLIPLPFMDNYDVRRAEQIVAIGSPLGLLNSVSFGNVSALFKDEGVSFIQFTAPISSGSSGGALFNDKGQVIGITTGSLTEGQNINLAVSIDEIINLYNKDNEYERVTLSKYSTLNSIPTPTLKPTPKPVTIPTVTPSSTFTLTPSKEFDGQLFDNNVGYENNKFEKLWFYKREIKLNNEQTLYLSIHGDKQMNTPPILGFTVKYPTTYGLDTIKLIDVLINNDIFTYINPFKEASTSFFYLGSVGEQMIKAMSEAKMISIRLVFRNKTEKIYDLKAQNFSSLSTWCKNIMRHEVFGFFESESLFKVDQVHEAYIH